MAMTDTHPGASKLRTAMDRAGGLIKQHINNRGEEPLVLDQLVERRRISRLEAKTAVVSYVDSIFRQRTRTDGTVLAPSRERLIEELTELIVELEDRTCEEVPGNKVETAPVTEQ